MRREVAVAVLLTSCGLPVSMPAAEMDSPQADRDTGGDTRPGRDPLHGNTRMMRKLQQALTDLGYGVGKVDGRWGRGTEQALKRFQRDNGLQESGRLDSRTVAALSTSGTEFSALERDDERGGGAVSNPGPPPGR